MRINTLKTQNFQGLKGQKEWNFEKINILCQKNGAGKSSLLNAIKYAFSGKEPEGKMVTDGASSAAVGVEFADGASIIRQKTGKGNVTFAEKKKIPIKDANEIVVTSTGVPMDAIRVASSEEVLRSLSPQDFGALILKYTNDQLDKDTVASFVPDLTSSMRKYIDERFPDELFGISDVQAFYKQINEDRLTQKRAITKREEAVKALREKKPTTQLADLEKEKAELEKKKEETAVYKEKMAAYVKAKKQKEEQEKTIENYKKQIDEIKVEKREPSEKERMEKELAEKRERVNNARDAMNTFAKVFQDTKKVLEQIDTPICPLSEKLVCTTDKTKVKDELAKIVAESEEGLNKQKEIVKTTEIETKKIELDIRQFGKDQETYKRKELLMNELERVSKQVVEIPEEPKKVEDFSERLKFVENELKLWEFIKRADELEKPLPHAKEILEDFEKLTKAFAPKGPVMERITEKYMIAFEEVCNEKAEKLKSGMKVKFVTDNGVHVFVDVNGDDTFLDYNSLSEGEKALYIYLMLDLLNTLSGFGVLIIDELSVLDNETFSSLLDIIIEHKDDYDQIFIAMVNHDDTMQIIKDKGLNIVEIH